LNSPSLARVQARIPAPARAKRGLTPCKRRQWEKLQLAQSENPTACDYWLRSIGERGGFMTWTSSPHVLWLANVLDGVEYAL
jgi:hypothetical protein